MNKDTVGYFDKVEELLCLLKDNLTVEIDCYRSDYYSENNDVIKVSVYFNREVITESTTYI